MIDQNDPNAVLTDLTDIPPPSLRTMAVEAHGLGFGGFGLKHQFGDGIKLSEADFLRLSKAFFEEIEAKFAG